jgi:hypothetical protein
MKKNNVDEKLISWDHIFKELLGNAQDLTHDLLTGVSYVGASGVVVLALGVCVLFFLLRYAIIEDRGFWMLVAIITGSAFVVGLVTLKKFFHLRNKYSRLYQVQKELGDS